MPAWLKLLTRAEEGLQDSKVPNEWEWRRDGKKAQSCQISNIKTESVSLLQMVMSHWSGYVSTKGSQLHTQLTQSPLVPVYPGVGTLLSILASSWNWIRNPLCASVTSRSDQAEGRLQSALEKEKVLLKFKHSPGQVTRKAKAILHKPSVLRQ